MMNIFPFNINKNLDNFADSLANELKDHVPPELFKAKDTGIKDKKKLQNTINRIFSHVDDYNRENKPGLYKKARIGNTFMWKLREAGYDEKFIQELTKDMLVRLGKKQLQKK